MVSRLLSRIFMLQLFELIKNKTFPPMIKKTTFAKAFLNNKKK